MEKEIIRELSQKYHKSEWYILLLIKICKDNRINNIKKYLEKNIL